jgi:hypothetical protein
MKTRTWIFISIMVTALVTSACSSTFLVYKQGKGFFLENNSKDKFELFCTSGDFEKVLADTQLDKKMRDDLYKYNCLDERSTEKILEVYATMTVAQRKDLRTAFRKNGYAINYGPDCCGP